jgi:MSHA biogenesis protein MshI
MGFLPKRKTGSNALAVAFGPQRLEFALVHRANGSKPVVRACASVAMEESPLGSLRSLRKHLGTLRAPCVALLPAADYQIHVVEAPNVPEEEMRDAVRWRMKELLDYPVGDATIAVTTVPQDSNGQQRARSLFAVTARSSSIGERMKLFRDAKIPMRVIDVPEMAQRNIATMFEDGPRAIALLCFREAQGLLTFSANGALFLARAIEVGAKQITESAGEARIQLFDRIALELQRSLDHFDRQFSHVPIGKFLLGPLAQDTGLGDYLSRNLSMTADELDLDSVVDMREAPALSSAPGRAQHLHVLGAALRMEAA